ncbi:MAG: hypothetical protein GY940_30975, partial [bacterium]|nr:hypothetical protein [bacterium]
YLCAYIVPAKEVDPGELSDYLSASLPDYMIPTYFVPLEKIPLTPNGKIDRSALPEPGVGETGTEYTAPGTKIQRTLAGIWARILNIETNLIGIDDNFFQLGGHSLRAALMNTRVHKELNIKVPLAEIFKSPTIRELARYITRTSKNIYDEIRPVEKKEYYPQSSAQKRLFFLDQFEDIGTSYNIPFVFKLMGKLEIDRYEKPFKALINRHEALRTSFELIDNKPVQRVH